MSDNRFVKKAGVLFLLLAAIGCASGGPARTPGVTISQVSRVTPLRLAVRTLDPSVPNGVPVDYTLHVTNPFEYQISLTAVELETVGPAGAYSVARVRHAFSLTIKPQSETELPIRAWVQPLQDTDTGDVNGPVTIRGVASFASGAGVMKTAFAARVQ
jgi:hypothetical protein